LDTLEVSRYEFKYLLTREEVPEIRRFLLRYCSADGNAQGAEWYGIQSLYLDTPEYAFYRASSEKAAERLKLRVRGYASGTGPVKLEIKRRVGDVVSKKSMVTTREAWNRFGGRSLPEGNGTALPVARAVEQMRAAPKVLVSYERHALHSNIDDYVRVTFDRRIVCQPMRQWTLDGDSCLWQAVDDPATLREDDSTYVLELKFKLAAPAWLRDMVRTFGLVRRGFSKYTRSISRILPDRRDPAWDLRTISGLPARAWRVA
jgi:SPX domain protein involved in polyphosphate accumulation